MKKILTFVVSILILCPLTVNAASYKLSLSTSSTSVMAGDAVNIGILLTNVSGISEGLNVCQAKITASNVTINKVVGENGWNVTNGNVLIMDSANGVTSNTKIATIQAKINAAGMISLSDIMCTDGETEYSASNSSINFSIKQQIQNDNQGNEGVIVNKKDSLLESMNIKGIDIKFNPNQLSYSFEVANNIDKLDIEYVLQNKDANVKIIGNENLVVGENKIQIIVTSENNKSVYNLSVLKKDVTSEISNNEEEILKALEQNIELLRVRVNLNDKNKIVSNAILTYLKANNKDILYEVYDNNDIIYSVKILGKNIQDTNDFGFNIQFRSNYINTLDEQLKGKDYKIINFDYRGVLPEDTEIILYNMELDNEKWYLYNYNSNTDSIEYIGKVNSEKNLVLNLDKTSEYVLLNYINSSSNMIPVILLIIFSLLLLMIFARFVYKFFIKRKNNY